MKSCETLTRRLHIGVTDVQDYSHLGRTRRHKRLNQFFKGLLALQVEMIFPRLFLLYIEKFSNSGIPCQQALVLASLVLRAKIALRNKTRTFLSLSHRLIGGEGTGSLSLCQVIVLT